MQLLALKTNETVQESWASKHYPMTCTNNYYMSDGHLDHGDQ